LFAGEWGVFCREQVAGGDEPIDGSLPFETESSTDDLSVETADLSPPPAPTPAPAPRPIRRAPASAEGGVDLDGRYTRGESIGGGPLGSVPPGQHPAPGAARSARCTGASTSPWGRTCASRS